MYDGLVADLADFKANLIVEIDDNNPNRVNVLWPPQLAGQLRQFAVLAQFRLMYPPPVTSRHSRRSVPNTAFPEINP